jgi:hypothetical protein
MTAPSLAAGSFNHPIHRLMKLPLLRLLPLALTWFSASAVQAETPFTGRWALTIPGGGAGWLGVEEKGGALQGSILWGGGSVVPVQSVKIEGDKLIVTRKHNGKAKDESGKEINVINVETITATTTGQDLSLTTEQSDYKGNKSKPTPFTGHKIAPVPAAPDLAKVKFGTPVPLFNGKDLAGWRLLDPKADNGWSVVDGVLQNRVEKGKHCGNLRTDAEFEDFNLKLELRTQAGSNSGIYLRGIYEVQVAESFGKPLDSHNMGALYSRITPSLAAEKAIGEWQTLNITLVQRHLTVVLNGKTIIDNQPVLGCTGGALWSDETKPGPIYLQGDHTNIDYRNMVLTPVSQ